MGRYSKKLEDSHEKLKTTREALRQSERLADMGQLSAGIAHAVSNPLGVITMHTHILKEEVNKDSSIYSDIELITEQADRCKEFFPDCCTLPGQVKLCFRKRMFGR